MVVTLVGFPVALVIAWAFEMTPEGMKRTHEVAPGTTLPYWSKRKFATFVVGGVMIAAGLLAYQLLRPTLPSIASKPEDKSIAVLPFLNESGDPKDEYFSDGLSEELIAALAQIRELKVIGRSSSFRFKNKKRGDQNDRRKAGRGHAARGHGAQTGERVRIVAELINAADGIELWTQTFDRELKDIFAVQQEIAAAVASSLKMTLLGANERSSTKPATESAEAHNAYLQGHYSFPAAQHRRSSQSYRLF